MSHRILVVEDSETLRTLLKLALTQKLEARVQTVTNGQEALDLLESADAVFDLILLDINMPVMDGFEFLDKRRNIPKILQIPVVIMTTDSASDDRTMAFSLGANGFLKKPFQGRDILAAVKGALG